MKKQYVKPAVTVMKVTGSDSIMIGSEIKLNGWNEHEKVNANSINILWGGTQDDDETGREENGFLWGD